MKLRTADLLAVFAIVDAAVAAVIMQLSSHTLVAALIIAGTLALLFGYAAVRSDGTRLAVLGVLLALLLVLPQVLLIAVRPHSAAHDGVLLTEAAADRLVAGLNPYAHDYIDSIARSFFIPEVPVNFGLGHYVYMPGMILLDLPLRLLQGPSSEFSWMWIPGLGALGAAAYSLGWNRAAARASLIAVALNPLTLFDSIVQLNDLFFLAPLLGAFGALWRRHAVAAGILFGLSLGIKQQAVLLAPFLLLLARHRLEPRARLGGAAAAAAVLGAIVLPFLIWDARAFVASTAGFFYGSGVDAYPIRGLGLPGLLLNAGVIPNRWDPYPAGPIQAAAAAPLLLLAARDLTRRWSWSHCWAWSGALVLAVFLFGRVVAPNYLDLAFILFALALISRLQDVPPVEAAIA